MGRKRKHAALSESTRLLVDVLARTDALWWPDRRKWELRRDELLWERRRAYREHGIDLPGGGSQGERQAFGRLLGDLEKAGLLVVSRSRGRRVGCSLTAAGDSVARRMAACFTVANSWPAFQRCCIWQAFADEYLGGGGWPEHLLVAEEWTGDSDQNEQLQQIRQELVPYFANGWVVASGDGDAIRKYWLSVSPDAPPGLPIETASCPVPDAPPEIDTDRAATDFYDECWDAYGRELDAAAPEFPNNIVIPIPSGARWGSLAALIDTKKEPAA